MSKSEHKDYDAVVVGSGPNGLAAAILLQLHDLSVLLIEGKDSVGGGMRTSELTLPGVKHDVCAAIHPLAIASPFLSKLPLHAHGLEYIHPVHPAAHPFEDGTAAMLSSSIEKTADTLEQDSQPYQKLIRPFVNSFTELTRDSLGPLKFPGDPFLLAKFGLQALKPATTFANNFKGHRARGLWGGMAAHAVLPFNKLATSAIGLMLMSAGHAVGWPMARGGSVGIADALAGYFKSIGGEIRTGFYVKSLQDIPSARTILFDTTPRQLLQIAGHKMSSLYKRQLTRYRYGMGVFKLDWALDGPVPFKATIAGSAGTVHLGNTFEEIANSEYDTWKGKHSDKPFVLLAQQSIFDSTRVTPGKQALWGYCHVPNGSTLDRTDVIEKQIERFAPGFRDRVLQRSSMNTKQLEEYNPNYIGGDVIGGAATLDQLFTRPALRFSPYRTSAKGLYLCSASTPPGGGVHGMSGYHAARRVLKDIFDIPSPKI